MEEVLKTRLKTAAVFGIVMVSLLLAGSIGFKIICSLVLLGGMDEYLKITGNTQTTRWLAAAAGVAFVYLIFFHPGLWGTGIYVLAAISVIYTFFISTLYSKMELPHREAGFFIAILYPGFSMMLPAVISTEMVWDMHFWAWSLVLIWISDSGAYLVGRKLGKTKLFERISPKKTWEGFIGAGLFTVAGGFAILYIENAQDWMFWLATALIIWVVGTLGDLFESSIKRTFGVKDSGTFLPGHGGFLDRFDSLIMVIPYLCVLLWIKQLTL